MRLLIESMAYGPDAIARADDGRAVFVRGGVPGDVVEATVTQQGASFCRARVDEVVEPSPDRVEVPCPYAGVCGGCPWAHLRYTAQLEQKRKGVVDALTRIGHLDVQRTEELVEPCVDLKRPWGYRNKVELACTVSGNRTTCGMHGLDGGVIRVDSCALLDSKSDKLVKSVSGALGYLAGAHGLSYERIGIRSSRRTRDLEVAIWTEPGPFPRGQAAKVLRDATNATSIVRAITKGPRKARYVSAVERLGGDGSWSEKVGDELMRFSAPSFFQVNTRGAERLVSLVLEGLNPYPEEYAMDLYCGAGTFTLPLARRCEAVSAVESASRSLRDLRRNLEHANLTNVDVIGGDAAREFPDDEADLIVVDPPRAGLAEDVVQKLSAQPARAIAYVSCDPATLARDLARFEELGVFSPERITPVDLFPQTFHVETVTILTRG